MDKTSSARLTQTTSQRNSKLSKDSHSPTSLYVRKEAMERDKVRVWLASKPPFALFGCVKQHNEWWFVGVKAKKYIYISVWSQQLANRKHHWAQQPRVSLENKRLHSLFLSYHTFLYFAFFQPCLDLPLSLWWLIFLKRQFNARLFWLIKASRPFTSTTSQSWLWADCL